jgi:hypothetical protein
MASPMKRTRRSRTHAALLVAALCSLLLPTGTASAQAPYRPPNMEKDIFAVKEVKLDKFDRSGLVSALVSVARDFDKEDKVDYDLRSNALAIAGRLDKENEKVELCLKQLKEDGKTIGETTDKDRVLRRIGSGIKVLIKNKATANQKCAAYVTDIALRFHPEADDIEKYEKYRDDLKAAGHTADWSEMLGKSIRHSENPFGEEEEQVFVKPEIKMPGGKADKFGRVQSRVNGLVVRQLPSGAHAGAASAVNATALKEEGIKDLLFTFNQEVGPMMGGCLEEVIKFLRVRHESEGRVPSGYKIELGFQDKYQMKDGPSAATAFTILLDSLFTGEEIDDSFACTGDITADGMVQNIGGVAAKVRGATKRGCKIVGIPAGNANGVADVLVMDGPEQLMDIQIFTMKDFNEAQAISRKNKKPEVQQTLNKFTETIAVVKEKGNELLKNAEVQKRLDAVVAAMPNHLSAKLLLEYGRGQAPSKLSVAGSFQEIDIASSGLIRQAARVIFGSKDDAKISEELVKDAKESVTTLEKIGKQIDPRLKDYQEAALQMVKIFAEGPKQGEDAKKLGERAKESMERLQNVRQKLQGDPKIMEEIME